MMRPAVKVRSRAIKCSDGQACLCCPSCPPTCRPYSPVRMLLRLNSSQLWACYPAIWMASTLWQLLPQGMLWGLTSFAAAGVRESGSEGTAPSPRDPAFYPFPGQGPYDIPVDAWPEPRLPRGVRHRLLSLLSITQPACR